ncbi:conserved phage C-terminal domain-containing protein [Ligilactobacillus salivarius]|uniref:conserved phage C-terminal domain-containing protein n=1 Tax=Ligilactobacillus salivarius TaxID=1624 RepID=UPI00195B8CC1|nr:conserved phage C-terminal domain-containing protein [Ligilactobacillus salivarius]MBM6786951.1 conserved phage C-terminal domain-containing protein [Ligilactobacillus salivarius]
MAEKPNYYSILTADVRYDKELKANEKLLFSEITALANKYGYCTASNGYLADLYGVKKTTVSHWLIHLKEKNYISIEIERNDKKEIISRKIYPISTPIAQKNNRYSKNEQDPIAQKSKENITSINNINSEVDKESKRDRFDYDKFISWFNEITGRNFSSKALFKKYINARLNEGFTKEDIAKVVTFKASKWKDTEMKEYLRPNTLFALSHFDNYLQEVKEGLPEPQKKKSNTSSARRPERTEEEERLYQLRLYASEHPEIYESDTEGNIAIREELERLERNRVKGGGSTTE